MSSVSTVNGSPADGSRPRLLAKRLMSVGKDMNDEAKVAELENLSLPPTKEELARMNDVSIDILPKPYKREKHERVFVNRHIALDKVEWFGFDMDYTLAVYKSPEYEAMTYKLILGNLIGMGYPPEIGSWAFNPDIATRGLFLDIKYGNLLKLDAFANILACVHGHKKLNMAETLQYYPSNFITVDQIGSNKRFLGLNTLFDIPQVALFADLVDYVDNNPAYTRDGTNTGVVTDKFKLTYSQMYNDLRASVDFVHDQGSLKAETVRDLHKYVHKDKRLPELLQRMKDCGKRVFLATNSGYEYSNTIMSFLFSDVPGADWKSYFEVIIVDARKPLFFAGGTALRQVNLDTGALMLGSVTGTFEKGCVYAGGSSDQFCQMTGAHPKSILYIGDHIFGDILKSKKQEGWRTFLVVPELENELRKWDESRKLYQHLQNLEFIVAETYRDMDSNETSKPDTTSLFETIDDTARKIDDAVNKYFGSMFRTGSSTSFFAMQTARYADLYAPTFLNLINYPLFYDFRAPEQKLAHEF